jgi:hypothetical protein
VQGRIDPLPPSVGADTPVLASLGEHGTDDVTHIMPDALPHGLL